MTCYFFIIPYQNNCRSSKKRRVKAEIPGRYSGVKRGRGLFLRGEVLPGRLIPGNRRRSPGPNLLGQLDSKGKRASGQETRVVFPEAGGPAIHVPGRFRLRSKNSNKRFRGKTSVIIGRMILAVREAGTARRFRLPRVQMIRIDCEADFKFAC